MKLFTYRVGDDGVGVKRYENGTKVRDLW